MHIYAFVSYGVKIRIESNRKRIIDRVRRIANESLLGRLTSIEPEAAEHVFVVAGTPEGINLNLDGEDLGSNPGARGLYKYFESRLRLTVAEYARDLIFVHAGAIAWKGKAVIFPADSFCGKTTLVAALVKAGATYFSDDYAILDKRGFVHPFPRRLSIRHPDRAEIRSNVSATTLGGIIADVPLPVDAVVLTSYRKNALWNPKLLKAGSAVMQMIPFAIPVRANTELTLKVLKTIANRAIIATSFRGDTKLCINEIQTFLDKLLA